jgi:hypothetical protein
MAAVALGVLRANQTNNPQNADPSAKLYLNLVTLGSLASCGVWIWLMKGFRWWATSLMVLAELLTWGALVIAGMSITGDWL